MEVEFSGELPYIRLSTLRNASFLFYSSRLLRHRLIRDSKEILGNSKMQHSVHSLKWKSKAVCDNFPISIFDFLSTLKFSRSNLPTVKQSLSLQLSAYSLITNFVRSYKMKRILVWNFSLIFLTFLQSV